jgi:hypothetical protein
MQRNCRLEVFELFGIGIRQPAKTAVVHPQRVILFFNVACGNQVNVRLALHWYSFRLYDLWRGISALLRKLCVAIGLDN